MAEVDMAVETAKAAAVMVVAAAAMAVAMVVMVVVVEAVGRIASGRSNQLPFDIDLASRSKRPEQLRSMICLPVEATKRVDLGMQSGAQSTAFCPTAAQRCLGWSGPSDAWPSSHQAMGKRRCCRHLDMTRAVSRWRDRGQLRKSRRLARRPPTPEPV